jgi:hypothetical protein
METKETTITIIIRLGGKGGNGNATRARRELKDDGEKVNFFGFSGQGMFVVTCRWEVRSKVIFFHQSSAGHSILGGFPFAVCILLLLRSPPPIPDGVSGIV